MRVYNLPSGVPSPEACGKTQGGRAEVKAQPGTEARWKASPPGAEWSCSGSEPFSLTSPAARMLWSTPKSLLLLWFWAKILFLGKSLSLPVVP